MGKVIYLQRKVGDTMADIFDVAQYLKQRYDIYENKKIQKLCYYIQSWYLCLREKPLFSNNFEAWVNGPVCSELYKDIRYDCFQLGNVNNLSESDKQIIDVVYNVYGKFTADQLSERTHNETPWIEARKGIPRYENSIIRITKSSMKKYFKEIIKSFEN